MASVIRVLHIARFAIVIALAPLLLPIAAPVAAQDQSATPAAAVMMSAEDAIAAATVSDGVLRFDVSENATRWVFDPDFVHDDGLPAYGSTFITQGYIYPAGTLTESNGVNADGSPEFPDQVIGEWICRGWLYGDGAHTTSGPMVVSTQIFDFGDGDGQATIVSDGYELADIGEWVDRAVIGGTGPFTGAEGGSQQTLLGLNATEGVNLQFEFDLAGAGS